MTHATEKAWSDREGDQLIELVAEIERVQRVVAGWDDRTRDTIDDYRRALDALHHAALRRLIKALREEPHALAALKTAAEDRVVHAVLRYHGLVKASLGERVEAALLSVRPILASHGGDVELVALDPPRIEVRFTGTCDSCAASALTFHAGVKKAVQEACPEITEVVHVRSATTKSAAFASPFAIESNGRWHPAGAIVDIPDPGAKPLQLDGTRVLLFRHGSAVACFRDACAHLGAPLSHGTVDAGILTCPHHGFRYDLATGICLTAPDLALQPYAVRILAGRIEVRIAR